MLWIGANPAVGQAKLYGLTSEGGTSNKGVIIAYDPANGNSTRLYDFNGTDGANPNGSLTEYNNKLYGMTFSGGANGVGVLFSYDPVTGTYLKLRDFTGTSGSTPGANPHGSLTVYGNKLYGMTRLGGASDAGVLFSYDPANDVYSPLTYFTFNQVVNGVLQGDGTNPRGSLTLYNNQLYGMTFGGGNSSNSGVLFSYDPENGNYTRLHTFSGNDGFNPTNSVTVYNDKIYGMTNGGGSNNAGTLFVYDPATSSFSTLYNFNNSSTGGFPYGQLTVYNNLLYGLTSQGGGGFGVLFSFNPADNTYSGLRTFTNLNSNGTTPSGSLTLYNNLLYGMNQEDGSFGKGTAFSFNPSNNAYTRIIDFAGASNGGRPLYGQFLVFNACALSATATVSSGTACVGSAVSLSAVVTGNSGSPGFAWQGPGSVNLSQPATTSAVSATLSQSGVQTFTVTVTSGGCSTSAAVSVTASMPPSPTVTNTPAQLTACEGTAVSLSATAASGQVEFSTDAGFSNPTVGSPVSTPASAGSYVYYVRTIDQGCVSPAVSVTATVYANPVLSLTNNGPLTCAQTSVTLTATAGLAAYSFSAGATPVSGMPNQATVSTPGLYSVTATNSAGCITGTTTSVTSNTAAPTASLAKSGDLSCTTPSVVLTASPADAAGYVFAGPGVVAQNPTSNTASVNQPGTYTVTVTANNNCSASATVTIGGSTSVAAPQITTQPASASSVCAGTNVSTGVTATGTNLQYQWYKDGHALPGQIAATLSLTDVQPGDAGSYSCVVTSLCGSASLSVTSGSFALSVKPATAITNPLPGSVTTCIGSPYTVAVGAVGSNLQYQWFKDGKRITGQTTATLTIAGVQARDAGTYSCSITGDCSSSALSTTMVLSTAQPTAITTQPPGGLAVCPGGTATATVKATGTSLQYQWYMNGMLVQGQTTATLNLVNVQAADAGSYSCVVSGFCGNVTSTAFVLTVNPATAILTQPASASVVGPGSTVVVSVSATGSNVKYQWYKDGSKIGGQTSTTLKLSNVKVSASGSYSCVVTGDCGSVTSTAFALTVSNSAPVVMADPTPARIGISYAEVSAPLQIEVYPNPATTSSVSVQIQGAAQKPVRLQLLDTKGRIVSEQMLEVQSQQHTERLDIGNVPAGLLLLRVSTPEQSQTKKIIKP
ncbi:hypothetical protein GCM10023187_14450 [Nibrella viscosa]|uniref:Ig-like domain-containing protein n=1 Tax=Nibrella viscosa TaxID=1084524 RepID=A0ABP8K5A7_9BACT